jgi:hypothetical protein
METAEKRFLSAVAGCKTMGHKGAEDYGGEPGLRDINIM